jgi:hypothetical protein
VQLTTTVNRTPSLICEEGVITGLFAGHIRSFLPCGAPAGIFSSWLLPQDQLTGSDDYRGRTGAGRWRSPRRAGERTSPAASTSRDIS